MHPDHPRAAASARQIDPRSADGNKMLPLRYFALALLAVDTSAFRVAPQAALRPMAPVSRTTPVLCSSAPQTQATTAASILGLVSQPIFWWSLYTLKTTGCGLPAGPFGLIGAAEGIS